MSKPVIVDVDGSADDIIALMYLASNPDIEVKGITIAATGEVDGLQGAKNMAAFCHQIGLDHSPLAYGSATPLSDEFIPFPPFYVAL